MIFPPTSASPFVTASPSHLLLVMVAVENGSFDLEEVQLAGKTFAIGESHG